MGNNSSSPRADQDNHVRSIVKYNADKLRAAIFECCHTLLACKDLVNYEQLADLKSYTSLLNINGTSSMIFEHVQALNDMGVMKGYAPIARFTVRDMKRLKNVVCEWTIKLEQLCRYADAVKGKNSPSTQGIVMRKIRKLMSYLKYHESFLKHVISAECV